MLLNMRRMRVSRLSSSAVDTVPPLSIGPGSASVLPEGPRRFHHRARPPNAEPLFGGTHNMLSAEGCRQRRERFWQQAAFLSQDAVLLGQPFHLMYLANFHVDPFSLGGGFGGALLLRRDGHATLIHDNRLPASVKEAHVDATQVIPWYDGQSPGHGPRQLAL